MADEPGPFAVREEMPLRRNVVQPREFEGVGAELARALGGADIGFAGVVATIAPLAARELDSAYNTDVAPAAGGLEQLDTPGDAAELASIVNVVDAVAADAGAQLLDLPDPNAPDPVIPNDPSAPPGDPGRE